MAKWLNRHHILQNMQSDIVRPFSTIKLALQNFHFFFTASLFKFYHLTFLTNIKKKNKRIKRQLHSKDLV